MRAGGVPKLGLLAFDERVADFAVGDLRRELGRGEAPVEDYQTGARAGTAEEREVEIEAVLAHEADECTGTREPVGHVIGDPRASAIELDRKSTRLNSSH